MTRTRKAAAVVCLLILGGAGTYWYWGQSAAQQPQQQAGRPGRRPPATTDAVPVLAATARVADVPVYLDGVGTAKALNTVTVRAQVDGKLMEISFSEGQDVEKGYVLAKIDPTTYQAAYDQALAKKAQDEAQLTNARLDLDRYTRLAASNAIGKQQADTQKALVNQLQAQVNSDQAMIDNARAILSYTNIVAPLSGRTGIRMVDAGNIIRQSDANGIVMITQVKPISVLFNLPQQELPRLTRGMAKGQLTVEAMNPEGKAALDTGKVQVIDNQVDQTTGTVKLKAEFPNADLQLWPGQFVNIRLLIDTLNQVVVVPTAAVQRGPNGTFVYAVKDDDSVTVRQVTIQQQNDREAVVASGVQANDRVVTTGFARLAEGTHVQVASAEDAGQVSTGRPPRPRRDGPRGSSPKGKASSNNSNPTTGGPPSTAP
jgi:multidrug efflux system membrane fusion protein